MIHRHPLSLTDKNVQGNTMLKFAESTQFNACNEIRNVLRLTPEYISSTPFPTLSRRFLPKQFVPVVPGSPGFCGDGVVLGEEASDERTIGCGFGSGGDHSHLNVMVSIAVTLLTLLVLRYGSRISDWLRARRNNKKREKVAAKERRELKERRDKEAVRKREDLKAKKEREQVAARGKKERDEVAAMKSQELRKGVSRRGREKKAGAEGKA